MVTHYFTLLALTRELDGLLRGAKIEAIFSQQKNELVLALSQTIHGSAPAHWFLCISVNPTLNYLFVREQFDRARKNSVDLFEEIIGSSIDAIQIHRHDRLVSIVLTNSKTLHCQLYNTAGSNVLLVNSAGIILQAFKNNKSLAGKPSEVATAPSAREDLPSPEAFCRLIADHGSETVFSALKSFMPQFGSTYAREVLHRARLSEHAHADSFTVEDAENLRDEIGHVLDETNHPRPTIYARGAERKILSIITLQHLSGSSKKEYSGMNDAVMDFVRDSFRATPRESEKERLTTGLKSELERTRRSLRLQREQLTNVSRAEEYDRIGKIIMANLQHLTKGTREVDLPDIFGSGAPKRILLEPQLTPARNAERYFDKAKKARAAKEELDNRVQKLAERTQVLDKLLLHLDQCQEPSQVLEFKNIYRHELSFLKPGLLKGTEGQPPFRVFTVEGGFEVWVGKSSANNDLLTMHHTKPNDLWFHIRGAGGSHTVLKVHGAQVAPGKGAILQAAAIAAYYSKMRNAGSVPVAYCERKYVRKPRHAAPGTVVLEHEKVVFVRPALP
ncbi:MAG TPA: NFACT RNA binding domain-containing protein [Bacteroidota bacterium]|nr:NFACT RNA binding domain-containing protein [Bacteroidota bacterium]